MYERISIDPKVCHGQACIRGTRIPVHQMVRMIANGDSIDALLDQYPNLAREDIYAAVDYAASLAEEEVSPLDAVGRMPDAGGGANAIRLNLDGGLRTASRRTSHAPTCVSFGSSSPGDKRDERSVTLVSPSRYA